MASVSSLRLLLLLLLLGPALTLGAKFDFYLKRFKGSVDAICVTWGGAKQASLENADELIIGSAALVQGANHLCASVVWIEAESVNTIFQITDQVPGVITTASFNMSVWTAKPTDSVSLTVENGLPNRPLSVEGAPLPIELAAPATTNSDPPSTTLGARPARQFNGSYASEADVLASFLDWFPDIYMASRGAQGAIIYYPDTDDPTGSFLKTIYTIFSPTPDGNLIAHLFKASFALDASSQAPVVHKRRLMQYYDEGGVDKAPPKTVICKKIWLSPTKSVVKCS